MTIICPWLLFGMLYFSLCLGWKLLLTGRRCIESVKLGNLGVMPPQIIQRTYILTDSKMQFFYWIYTNYWCKKMNTPFPLFSRSLIEFTWIVFWTFIEVDMLWTENFVTDVCIKVILTRCDYLISVSWQTKKNTIGLEMTLKSSLYSSFCCQPKVAHDCLWDLVLPHKIYSRTTYMGAKGSCSGFKQ